MRKEGRENKVETGGGEVGGGGGGNKEHKVEIVSIKYSVHCTTKPKTQLKNLRGGEEEDVNDDDDGWVGWMDTTDISCLPVG